MFETASGTGEHICFFGEKFAGITWYPSDKSSDLFWAIRERALAQNNIMEPSVIDLTNQKPDIISIKCVAVININMIHIAPWEACTGLFRLARSLTKKDGFVYLYGPFKIRGLHTSESNRKFDISLRKQDPNWGIRDLEDVVNVAEKFGFHHFRSHEMPVNNKSVIFKKIKQKQSGI